jgi:hypothetical protein
MGQLTLLIYGIAQFMILREPVENSHILSAIWIQVIVYGVLLYCNFNSILFQAALDHHMDRQAAGNPKYAWLLKSLEDFNATLMLQLCLYQRYVFVFVIQYYLLFRFIQCGCFVVVIVGGKCFLFSYGGYSNHRLVYRPLGTSEPEANRHVQREQPGDRPGIGKHLVYQPDHSGIGWQFINFGYKKNL